MQIINFFFFFTYSVLDIAEAVSEETAQKISGIKGVLKVRVIK